MGRRSPTGRRNEQFNVRIPEALITHVDQEALRGPDPAKRTVAGLVAFEWANDELKAKLCEVATRLLLHQVEWSDVAGQTEADVLKKGSVEKALASLAQIASKAQESRRQASS